MTPETDSRTGPAPRVTALGVGADLRLDPAWLSRIGDFDVVLGGRRHLGAVPELPGQRRLTWPVPLSEGLPGLLDELRHDRVLVLASGDPLVSGIGTTLIGLLGRDAVEVVPGLSSPTLARARLGWAAEGCTVVSVVGRPLDPVRRELVPGRRLLVLTSGRDDLAPIAQMLIEAGVPQAPLTVLADLGAVTETVTARTAEQWLATASSEVPALYVLAIEVPDAVPQWQSAWVAGLPDDAFEHDGQLTKRDLRAAALARLRPAPGQYLWDVGAGAGSIGIEWLRAHPATTATAIEADPERAARIGRNAARLGVPSLEVVTGRAPDALAGLPAPDAIFVGGGATRPGVLDACLAALRDGGRLVIHAVTLETEQLLAETYRAHGGELVRISVQQAAPVGGFTGWSPSRQVTQWTLQR